MLKSCGYLKISFTVRKNFEYQQFSKGVFKGKKSRLKTHTLLVEISF